MSTEVFTDETLMPFGLHKGKKMVDVPGHWLIWYRNTSKGDIGSNRKLLDYIEDNMDVFKAEGLC